MEPLELAMRHHEGGRLAEAEQGYLAILQAAPRNIDALHFLGFLEYQRGNFARAEQLVSQSLALNRANVHAHFNLGRVFQAQAKLAQAAGAFGAALELEPRHADASLHLGMVLSALGRHEEALERYLRARELAPQSFEASYNIGIVCRELGRGADAMAALRRALELKPDAAVAHFALGHLLRDDDRIEQALACFRRALELDPDYAEARWSIAMSQIPSVYAPGDDPAACRARLAAEVDDLRRWFDARRSGRGADAVGIDQPFGVAYIEEDSSELLRRHGELCVELMAGWRQRQGIGAAAARRTGGPLRVAVVSAHFREHSVWTALVRGWFAHLDPQRVALHAFDLGLGADEHTGFARERAASMTAGPMDLRQWVDAILACQPDVLIYPEIGMDTTTVRLASLRLAPVQAATWGHPQTTGLPTIDYYLSADAFEPEGSAAHYTERLVRLPRLGCCVEPWQVNAVLPDLARWGVDADVPLLICPGVPYKYSPAHDGVFPAIARRLGECQFLFFRYWKQGQAERLEARLRAAFERAGLDLEAHAVFIPWQTRAAFFGWMQRADAYLDTIGFSGFNTALQAVQCGLPIVTREGRFLRGRLASGIMRQLGLDELVAASDEEYAALAARLVEDADFSERVAGRLEQHGGSAFGDRAPVRALEQFLLSVRG